MEKETFIYEVTDFDELYRCSWSGALQTLDTIKEYGKEEELMEYINDFINECTNLQMIPETKLNDLLWFDRDCIFEDLGIAQDEE